MKQPNTMDYVSAKLDEVAEQLDKRQLVLDAQLFDTLQNYSKNKILVIYST